MQKGTPHHAVVGRLAKNVIKIRNASHSSNIHQTKTQTECSKTCFLCAAALLWAEGKPRVSWPGVFQICKTLPKLVNTHSQTHANTPFRPLLLFLASWVRGADKYLHRRETWSYCCSYNWLPHTRKRKIVSSVLSSHTGTLSTMVVSSFLCSSLLTEKLKEEAKIDSFVIRDSAYGGRSVALWDHMDVQSIPLCSWWQSVHHRNCWKWWIQNLSYILRHLKTGWVCNLIVVTKLENFKNHTTLSWTSSN